MQSRSKLAIAAISGQGTVFALDKLVFYSRKCHTCGIFTMCVRNSLFQLGLNEKKLRLN